MTKQVFQLKDPVPTSKPDVPGAREHPVFAPGHAPVQQPQGAPPQQGQPAAQRCQGAQKRKAPAQAKRAPKPRAKSKSWTKEEAAALYPEYAIGTRVQLSFEYATAAGPSKWIWAQRRSSTGTLSPGTTRGSRSTSSGTRPPPTTRRWGAPPNSGETEPVVRWSPCSCAPPTRSTSPEPSTRAKSTMHGPYRSPRSGTARHPQLRASSTSSTPDEPGPDTARPPNYRSPETGTCGSPRPHQHPQRACGHLRPHQGRHTASHTRATPSRRRPPGVPGASPPQSGPTRTSTDPGPGGEQISRPLATGGAPLPQDVSHGACPPRPRSGWSPRGS